MRLVFLLYNNHRIARLFNEIHYFFEMNVIVVIGLLSSLWLSTSFSVHFVSTQISCSIGETVLKIKETLRTGSDQVNYQILLGEDVLFSKIEQDPSISSPFVRCLSDSTNSQYTIKLLPSSGSSWPDGSLLTLYGKYDNVVFRNALSTSSEESYVLSLYYGIDRDALWKMMSGSVADGWTAYSFSDDTWSDVTLGSGATI